MFLLSFKAIRLQYKGIPLFIPKNQSITSEIINYSKSFILDIATSAPTIPLQKSYGSFLKALSAPAAPVRVLKNRNPHPLIEVVREDTNHSRKIIWQKLAIPTNDEIRFIPFDDIIYCMATSNS